MNDFRTALSEELAELSAPPLTGLVEAATRDGRRVRRRRTVAAATGSVTAVAVAVGLLAGLVGQADRAPAPQAAAASSPAATPHTLPLGVAATGHLVETTPQALLATVIHLLPSRSWKTDNYTVNSVDHPFTMLDVTSEQGTGLVAVAVLPSAVPVCLAPSDGACAAPSALPKPQVEKLSGPCKHTVVVTVQRSDSQVQVTYGDCRQGEGDNYYPSGVSVLTADQAIALASDPGLGPQMDSALVDAAAERYRDAALLR